MMRKAGFPPEALGRYLARVQPEDLGPFSPLPQRSARIASIEAAISRLQSQSANGEFRKVQEELRTITSAPSRPKPSLFHP